MNFKFFSFLISQLEIDDFRTAQQEEIVRRVRYPRHVGRDGLVRPYIAHEAMGFFILNVKIFRQTNINICLVFNFRD